MKSLYEIVSALMKPFSISLWIGLIPSLLVTLIALTIASVLFIDIIFYLSDFYFKNLKEQNILNNDKAYELKSFVLDNINKYLSFNLNQNSLINAINNKFNYE